MSIKKAESNLVKMLLFTFFTFFTRVGGAGCPDITPGDLPSGFYPPLAGTLENVNGVTDRGRIVGCKTDGITNDLTTVKLTKEQLTGTLGMENLSLGNHLENAPIGSANIIIDSGGAILDYPLRPVGYEVIPNRSTPSSNGEKILFNFYYQCRYNWNLIQSCQRNRPRWFLQGLRDNTDIFLLGGQTGISSNTGNELVRFENVEFFHEVDSVKKILANVRFLYKNLGRVANIRGQGFIHFAVWAEIQPVTTSTDPSYMLTKAGGYEIEVTIDKNRFTNHIRNRY